MIVLGDEMAYHIFYQSDKRKVKTRRSSLRFPVLLLLCFILFLYLVGSFWPDGTEFLRRTIRYENYFTITAKLNNLAEKLRYTKEPLAVFAEFCGKIVP